MNYIASDPIAVSISDIAIQTLGGSSVSALLLDGPPGTGKTYLGKYMAHRMNARFIQFQFFPGCGREDMLYDKGPNGEILKGTLLLAMEESLKNPIVLLLDELDKAEPKVDSFLLTFLQEGSLFLPIFGELKCNTENLLVVITKNDEREASGPLQRRCRRIYMQWPTEELETKIITQAHPWISQKACSSLIYLANKLRHHINVKRPPSTPELMRLAADLILLIKKEPDIKITDLGIFTTQGLCSPADRAFIPENNLYIGSLMKENFQPLTTQDQ